MATLGNSAPNQNTVNYDALLSTTFMAYRAVLVDNIFKANAFLAALRKFGGIDYQNGGERIQQPLMYEQNDTFRSYRGYEQLDVKPQDGITSAFYPWCEVGGTITISRREERQNAGEAMLLNLLKSKIQQAEMSLKATINSQLILGTVQSSTFVPGNSAKDLNPLGYFLRDNNTTDPVAGGTVGGISAASYTWWRNRKVYFNGAAQSYDNAGAAVTTFKGLQVYLYRLYNWCVRGADGSGPNLVLCNQETYEAYENSLNVAKIYLDEELVSMGFDNVKLKGAVMIWDELVPDVYSGTAALTYGSAFFLNTQFYKLIIDQETDFITTPFVEPENQTAKTAKVLFMGNTICNNPRKIGLADGISLAIVA